MKYLTDSEILKFNDNLKEANIRLSTMYSNQTGQPELIISTFRGDGGVTYRRLDDFATQYKYSFSVVENRKDNFLTLLTRLLNEPLGTKVLNSSDNSVSIELPQFEVELFEHEALGRKFIKYTYNFCANISQIVSHISYIEDAINYFELMYGYDEDGNETTLTKFKLGDIVSLTDRSKDYLIVDYDYYQI